MNRTPKPTSPAPTPADSADGAPAMPAFRPTGSGITIGVNVPRRHTSTASRGEPMVWLTGGMVAVCLLMIFALLGFIFKEGFTTFWPKPLVQLQQPDGQVVLGEPSRTQVFQAGVNTPIIYRTLYKTGNFDLTGTDFIWVDDDKATNHDTPTWGLVIERVGWLNAYGTLAGIQVGDTVIDDPAQAWEKFQELHGPALELQAQIYQIEKHDIGAVSDQQNEIAIRLRAVERKFGPDSPELKAALAGNTSQLNQLSLEYRRLTDKLKVLRQEADSARLIVRTSSDALVPADRAEPEKPLFIWQIVRAYPANQLGFWGRLSVYGSRWWEYLTADPREANMEGGVFPAIVGTILLTFLMILIVVPLGVIASIYLREYAKQGLLVSIVRIAVNNLAGVPSIVYGVFGLGFFCYLMGGAIDDAFYKDRLPDATVGKSALIWASLTLALLTLPVVIVSTEEALAAVPRSSREAAYACGASTWQMIWRTVLPRAMPGIMTGMILAIARGAGEVAPLMLVGAVKIAPELPVSGSPPFFGTNRSFLHLGFHIYDLAFQSRNAEASRSMVYTTTLLLILIVVILNISAMWLRSRLRKAYATGNF